MVQQAHVVQAHVVQEAPRPQARPLQSNSGRLKLGRLRVPRCPHASNTPQPPEPSRQPDRQREVLRSGKANARARTRQAAESSSGTRLGWGGYS